MEEQRIDNISEKKVEEKTFTQSEVKNIVSYEKKKNKALIWIIVVIVVLIVGYFGYSQITKTNYIKDLYNNVVNKGNKVDSDTDKNNNTDNNSNYCNTDLCGDKTIKPTIAYTTQKIDNTKYLDFTSNIDETLTMGDFIVTVEGGKVKLSYSEDNSSTNLHTVYSQDFGTIKNIKLLCNCGGCTNLYVLTGNNELYLLVTDAYKTSIKDIENSIKNPQKLKIDNIEAISSYDISYSSPSTCGGDKLYIKFADGSIKDITGNSFELENRKSFSYATAAIYVYNENTSIKSDTVNCCYNTTIGNQWSDILDESSSKVYPAIITYKENNDNSETYYMINNNKLYFANSKTASFSIDFKLYNSLTVASYDLTYDTGSTVGGTLYVTFSDNSKMTIEAQDVIDMSK